MKCVAIGTIFWMIVLFFSHYILDKNSGWYQSKEHALFIAYRNQKFGFENDSLFLEISKNSEEKQDILESYQIAYTGTLGFMRGLMPGLYLYNEILHGNSYTICNDTIFFTFTDRYIGCLTFYYTYIKEERLLKVVRDSKCGEGKTEVIIHHTADPRNQASMW